MYVDREINVVGHCKRRTWTRIGQKLRVMKRAKGDGRREQDAEAGPGTPLRINGLSSSNEMHVHASVDDAPAYLCYD